MIFKDGEFTGENCPTCGAKLLFELSFRDCFSYKTGHYTTDCPIVICEKCDFYRDYLDESYID